MSYLIPKNNSDDRTLRLEITLIRQFFSKALKGIFEWKFVLYDDANMKTLKNDLTISHAFAAMRKTLLEKFFNPSILCKSSVQTVKTGRSWGIWKLHKNEVTVREYWKYTSKLGFFYICPGKTINIAPFYNILILWFNITNVLC